MSFKKILVLAPHTDDGELGCGGSITRFCREGNEVFYVAFSTCRRSLPKHLPPDTLEKEVIAATKILGIKRENLILFDYDVRDFPKDRQRILEDMVRLKTDIKPDIVFVPSLNDLHQDHQVIANEGLRAFKNNSLLGYEMPWNNVSFNTNYFISLQEQDIAVKIKALKEYESQKNRNYLNEDFIKSLAYTRGVQIGARYAEAFDLIRWVNW
jgi:N-acetylglucosamine malate deacetylase 1